MGGYSPSLMLRPPTPFDPVAEEQKLTQLRLLQGQPALQAEQLKAAQLANQETQYQVNARQALNEAYQNAVSIGDDGKPAFDTNKITQSLSKSGYGSQVPGILQHMTEYQKSQADLQEAQQKVDTAGRDALGSAGLAIKAANYDPGFADVFIQHQLAMPGTSPQNAQALQRLRQVFQQNPDSVKSAVEAMIQNSPKAIQSQKEQQETSNQVEKTKIERERLEFEKQNLPVDKRELNDYLNNPAIDPTVKNKDAATFATWKAHQSPMFAIAASNLLGPAGEGGALDQAADMYHSTGQIPQGFGRSPQTVAAVIKRSADKYPTQNIALNKAEYGANQQSLKNLQKNFDQVTAFENTAIKNVDLALQKAAKIPDLGTRFANTPVRMISDKLLGTKEMGEFRAALLTAQTEAAKVLNSANATGVLSDSARHELEDMISGNMPYNTMKGVFQTIKQDFANRHASYQQQIEDIQNRLKGGAPNTTTDQNNPPKKGGFDWSKFSEHKQ